MTAIPNKTRMTLVQIGDDPQRKILLSEAEIAAFEARFAQAASSHMPTPAEPLPEIPTFTGTDAEILEAGKPATQPRATGVPFWKTQRFLIGAGGGLLALVIIVIS